MPRQGYKAQIILNQMTENSEILTIKYNTEAMEAHSPPLKEIVIQIASDKGQRTLKKVVIKLRLTFQEKQQKLVNLEKLFLVYQREYNYQPKLYMKVNYVLNMRE